MLLYFFHNGRREFNFLHNILILLLILGFFSDCLGQNQTVGDNNGTDDCAYSFSPHRNESGLLDRGEEAFRDNVADMSPFIGQQYTFFEYWEPNRPGVTPPAVGTLANFYKIIATNSDNLGIFLYSGHGSNNRISVEIFEKTVAGASARNARFTDYINGNVDPSIPAFSYGEIDAGSTPYAHVIVVTDILIDIRGDLTQGLAYVSSCEGASLTDDFVIANARVSVGDSDHPYVPQQRDRVTTFFYKDEWSW